MERRSQAADTPPVESTVKLILDPSPANSSSPLIGQSVSHYNIIKELGRGAMGEVYLAQDTTLPRKVALKFLAPTLANLPDSKARFKREAEAMASIQHPNVITVHEVGDFENRPYFVMEYVEGGTLGDLIAGKDLTIHDVLDIMIQICEGVREAHQQNILHRDLKPSNILINRKGLVKIADFGLAKLREGTAITMEGTRMGTIQYMSPEQFQGGDLDERSDIFSLGVIFYELMTRQRPFQGDNDRAVLYAITFTTPPPLAQYAPDMPEGLQRIIEQALAKTIEKRYQKVDSLLIKLQSEKKNFLRTIISHPHIPPPPINKNKWHEAISNLWRKAMPYHKEFKIVGLVLLIFSLIADIFGIRGYFESKSMTSVISISTEPKDAEVVLNGKFIGKAPIPNTSIQAGKVSLGISKAGYVSIDTSIVVEKGTNWMLPFTLKKAPAPLSDFGSIRVNSKPTGAMVFLNGSSIGVTPLNFPVSDSSIIKLSLQKPDYFPIDTSVVAQTGQDSTFLFALRPLAQISLQVTPDNAEVVLDEKMILPSQFKEMKLSTGLHRISISAEGYEPIAEQFSLLQGVNPTRRYELKKPVVPPPPNLEPRKIPILISSNPNGATVFLNGDNVGVTPLRFTTKDNETLKLRLRKPDYFPIDTSVVIQTGQDSTFLFALRPLAEASLQVTPANAKVVLDGKVILPSQFKEMKLSTGLHRISISAEGHESIAEQFSLLQGVNPTRRYELKKPVVRLPPKPLLGSIRITSKPDSATVLLDSREAGMTPKTFRDLDEGTYQIVLRKKGYKDYSASVQVISGQMLPLDFKLTALPGTLKVAVKPSGSIFIDGKLYSQNIRSPFRQELPAGTYRLRVVNSDSAIWEKTVNIESEMLLDVPIDFTKTYKLTITSTPVLGEISVDGKYRGSAPKQLALRTGQHAIKTRREGYVQTDTTINLENDWQQPLKLILRKIP